MYRGKREKEGREEEVERLWKKQEIDEKYEHTRSKDEITNWSHGKKQTNKSISQLLSETKKDIEEKILSHLKK